ncbi:VC0807 family protein [Paenibacillus allorhizosphaerae]|uniref:Intracellular septation protein A n=1 Tax=Paenibacillus allorhizosphaerae TaxID=2849866 RepID=A0ABM8VLZ0_9BACL|nr:VC0807 family protein [Paenibacillus allorhizosphaerae]CAG7649130.1 hypothetical protein PAECIP111802_04412 [Paenibacillus allorhizosphaerae]
MMQRAEMKQHSRQTLKKGIPSLVVNWLIPLVLYSLLRGIVATDTAALAISGAVPALWVIVQMLGVRQIDWIGLLGAASFGAACLISVLSGGGSMPLKLYHPVVACLIGVVALASVAIQKPLALILFRSLKAGDPERFNKLVVRRKFSHATSVFGSLFIMDGIVHVIIAFSLSTGMFLIWSRIVTLVMLAVLVLAVRYILWQKKYD